MYFFTLPGQCMVAFGTNTDTYKSSSVCVRLNALTATVGAENEVLTSAAMAPRMLLKAIVRLA